MSFTADLVGRLVSNEWGTVFYVIEVGVDEDTGELLVGLAQRTDDPAEVWVPHPRGWHVGGIVPAVRRAIDRRERVREHRTLPRTRVAPPQPPVVCPSCSHPRYAHGPGGACLVVGCHR